jgi:hypothetical protein
MTYAAIWLQSLVAGIFLIASISKIAGWSLFLEAIDRLVPSARPVRWIVGPTVVGTEGAIVVMVATGGAAQVGYALACLLVVAFTWVILRAIRAGNTAACRCFGPSRHPLSRWTVLRNGLLFAATFAGWSMSTWFNTGGRSVLEVMTPGELVAALCALPAVMVLALFDDMVYLWSPARTVQDRKRGIQL